MSRPNFLIIGAYRSGTSSLTRYLAQHPDIFIPSQPEPSFFAFDDEGRPPPFLAMGSDDPFRRRRTTTLDTYLGLFASARTPLAGECSPEYLRHPGAAARIHAFDPTMKLVVSLRDPVDRAVSDYAMQRRDGTEQAATFGEALDRIPTAGPVGAHYVETGRYGQQLSGVFEVFPREQVLVLIAERWQPEPGPALAELADWLGADPTFAFDTGHTHNRSGQPRGPVAATYFRTRARLAPWIGARVPAPIKARAERAAAGWLDPIDASPEARARVVAALADDLDLLSSLLDDPLDCWPSRAASAS